MVDARYVLVFLPSSYLFPARPPRKGLWGLLIFLYCSSGSKNSEVLISSALFLLCTAGCEYWSVGVGYDMSRSSTLMVPSEGHHLFPRQYWTLDEESRGTSKKACFNCSSTKVLEVEMWMYSSPPPPHTSLWKLFCSLLPSEHARHHRPHLSFFAT